LEIIECAKINLNDITSSPILPKKVREEMKTSGVQKYVSIFTTKSKTLRFFPTDSTNVWWLRIAINSFNPETSGAILAKLNKLVNEFVYSTGICISKSECFWDGIILESAIKGTKEEIINELEEITNVSKVTIKPIE
jgi:hypothetical protein